MAPSQISSIYNYSQLCSNPLLPKVTYLMFYCFFGEQWFWILYWWKFKIRLSLYVLNLLILFCISGFHYQIHSVIATVLHAYECNEVHRYHRTFWKMPICLKYFMYIDMPSFYRLWIKPTELPIFCSHQLQFIIVMCFLSLKNCLIPTTSLLWQKLQ
jgi:hypothetical protein